MSYELNGKIHKIFDTDEVSDRFRKREFVVTADDNGFEQFIKFQLTQDRCNLIDPYQEGDNVNVHFNIQGREYKKPGGEIIYFTNLTAWKLEGKEASPGQADFPEPPDEAYNQAPPEKDDDLPF